jgi:hypothetical protein
MKGQACACGQRPLVGAGRVGTCFALCHLQGELLGANA